MTKLLNKIAEHPIAATIIGTVGSSIILWILSFIPITRGWIWSAMSWAYDMLIRGYIIPLWVIILVGLYTLFGLVILFIYVYRRLSRPPYLDYTEDIIEGLKWRWSWSSDGVSDLWCFCHKCDALLIRTNAGISMCGFRCERCLDIPVFKNGAVNDFLGKIKREIDRRIRTGEEYSESLEANDGNSTNQ